VEPWRSSVFASTADTIQEPFASVVPPTESTIIRSPVA